MPRILLQNSPLETINARIGLMSARIVFMGSPDFALPSLRALTRTYEVVGVVTQPDRASGRGRGIKMLPDLPRIIEMIQEHQ